MGAQRKPPLNFSEEVKSSKHPLFEALSVSLSEFSITRRLFSLMIY